MPNFVRLDSRVIVNPVHIVGADRQSCRILVCGTPRSPERDLYGPTVSARALAVLLGDAGPRRLTRPASSEGVVLAAHPDATHSILPLAHIAVVVLDGAAAEVWTPAGERLRVDAGRALFRRLQEVSVPAAPAGMGRGATPRRQRIARSL